jgi:hypothetical protein
MTTAPFRLPILALPLFLALGQGCFAGSPATAWGSNMSYGRMSTSECLRWSARALQEQGYSVETQEGTSAVIGTRDPYSAVVLCWAAPRFDVVFAANGGDAGRVMNDFLHRLEAIVHDHGRERRR